MAAIEEIEKVHPGQFTYYLWKDVGTTGRLEVTIWKDTDKEGEDGTGELVHSKAQSGQYIAADY